jgi:hypothetical protein
MDFKTFKGAFGNLGEIPSVTGRASYHSIRVSGNNLFLTRKNTGSDESISLTELFSVYQGLDHINTSKVKSYISGYVYTPSVAVLIAAGFYDSKGFRVEQPEIESVLTKEPEQPITTEEPEHEPGGKKVKPKSKESDELRFFRKFADVIGLDYIQAKGIERPIDTDLVELPCDYRKLTFKPDIKLMLKEIVELLDGDFNFGNNSLASKIDGLMIEHPLAGTRIVEFDEEQHFTPPRLFTLQRLSESIDLKYSREFISICNDTAYLNSQVIPKHRIKGGIRQLPANIQEFREWLEQHAKTSGYVEAKNGFAYHGGRISQRAYYDTLRDVAHLAVQNDHLDAPIRFAKKTFENRFHKGFAKISDEELEVGIKEVLRKIYEITIDQNQITKPIYEH